MLTLGWSISRAAAEVLRIRDGTLRTANDHRSLCTRLGCPVRQRCAIGAESRLGLLGDGVRGAHVPAAWPLSVRYNGSVDSSEEWEGIERTVGREPRPAPRPRDAAVAAGECVMVAI